MNAVTRSQLSRRNPFFAKEGNRARGFALRHDGRLIGHVLATINADLQTQTMKTGALGFLECEKDFVAFSRLLEPAIDWLRCQGVGRVWATMNFDIWTGYRVMTRGFEVPAFFGEPRNTTWLPDFLQRFGFTARKRWVSVTTGRDYLAGRVEDYRPAHESALADGYTFEKLELRDDEAVAALHQTVSTAFANFEGFTSISLADFRSIVGRYLRFVGTELSTAIRAPDGRFAGFSVAYPDPSESIRGLEGRDDWTHRLKLMRRRSPTQALHYMIGISPELLARRSGLGGALMYRTLQLILDANYQATLFALLSEDSPARHFAPDQVAVAEREYALFELLLPADASRKQGDL